VIVVASFVSPYAKSRDFARSVARNFVEVYMKTTVEACEQRDSKGHYVRARSGEYRDFPGVDASYDVPENPEIIIEVDRVSMDEATKQILNYLKKHILNS
jgi:adenylylsulfate kinase